ncbi:MAG: hypothetical protein ACFFDY_11545 [Candidatus Thorarchaeota archaeon]
MGKGGVVLGLIGILIGAGGLVFGFIAWSSLNTIQTQIDENIETWYTIDNSTYNVAPAATVLELINNTISFELTSTASVYMSFTCKAEIFPSGGTSSVFFFFKVDGVILTSPMTEVGNLNGGSTEDYFAVHIQHFIESMTAGSHNITVLVSSGIDLNYISEKTLFVQSST